jgi:predicted short-subunit dehydrogenase-like oxidoreductase (DUF2520 family)
MVINSIVLIGSGNVATRLGKAFRKQGKIIVQVLGRNQNAAKYLAEQIGASAISNPDQLTEDADLYLLAVPDDEISKIAKTLTFRNQLIAHTSGSVGMDVLQIVSSRYGVFYPLQTFSKTRDVDFSDIPVCIEASNVDSYISLNELAGEISNDVRKINSTRRQTIHLAAVFASNFTNYMYRLAEEILENENIPFDIVKPLIRETAKKIEEKPPTDAQTGPAVRKDIKIIEKHLGLLKNDPEKKEIYELLSKLIMENR